jgi:Holliday junction resolvasome RuvABC DNA-binding subunit
VTPPAEAQAPPLKQERDGELIGALLALGYSQAEAASAAQGIDGAELPLEERVRAALEYFAG